MRFTSRVPRLLQIVMVALPMGAPMVGQATAKAPAPGASQALVALGENVFNDVRLSSSGTMSCASCHRRERSFTENKPLAVGQSGLALGRNTPTLFGLASVEGFPVSNPRREFDAPKMVPLEERVLVPLRDHSEMEASVNGAVGRLQADQASVEAFDTAFSKDSKGDGSERGVTASRIGAALAAYVRSLQPKEGPGMLALAGRNVNLDESAARGLEIFRGTWRCQSCHAGPGLTDGRLHLASLPPAAPGAAEGAETRPSARRPVRPANVIRQGGYGGPGQSQIMALEKQTLPLLEVSRTAPYFRDGSEATLSGAVSRHVVELRAVGNMRAAILANPGELLFGFRSVKVPAKDHLSEATMAQLDSDAWIPPEPTKGEIEDVVAFLTSLAATP